MNMISNQKTSIPVFPQKPTPLSLDEIQFYREKIKRLLKKRSAVMISHYYTDPEIQQLTEETGGCVTDSLEMARFGAKHPASTLLIVGVRFMGETAKILNPKKTILMPALNAECSLDLSCPIDQFTDFCDMHPDRTVVVYANTSVEVKARADWVATSQIAIELIVHLDSLGEKIIWAPDRHLGNYLQKQTGADVLCWKGACIVHDEFKTKALIHMKALYPNAAILVHPESPQSIIAMADVVGSTSQLIVAARKLLQKQLIVATDRGIFYKMKQAVPEKELLEAPTAGDGAACRSCARCPWMAMNNLKAVADSLEDNEFHEIHIDSPLREKALIPLNRMLDFVNTLHTTYK